jgi:hypothetical protein
MQNENIKEAFQLYHIGCHSKLTDHLVEEKILFHAARYSIASK